MSSEDENADNCKIKSKCHVVGRTRGRGWAATCATWKLELLRTGTQGTFSGLLEGIEGNYTRCLYLAFSSCTLWIGARCLNPAAIGVFKLSK